MQNSHEGWIKTHRKKLNWEWMTKPLTAHLFEVLCLSANFEDGKWCGKNVRKGSMVASVAKLSKISGMSAQSVRTSLNHLKSTNEITIETTANYSLITINNWDEYQKSDKEDNKRLTNDQQTTNNIIRMEEGKNGRNEEEREGTARGVRPPAFTPPSLDEVRGYCSERGNGIDPEAFVDFYASKGWLVGKTRMRDWKAAVRTWERRDAVGNVVTGGTGGILDISKLVDSED